MTRANRLDGVAIVHRLKRPTAARWCCCQSGLTAHATRRMLVVVVGGVWQLAGRKTVGKGGGSPRGAATSPAAIAASVKVGIGPKP